MSQISFVRINFNFNSLNAYYLYTPFFPIQGIKRKKMAFLSSYDLHRNGTFRDVVFFFRRYRESFLIKPSFCIFFQVHPYAPWLDSDFMESELKDSLLSPI